MTIKQYVAPRLIAYLPREERELLCAIGRAIAQIPSGGKVELLMKVHAVEEAAKG